MSQYVLINLSGKKIHPDSLGFFPSMCQLEQRWKNQWEWGINEGLIFKLPIPFPIDLMKFKEMWYEYFTKWSHLYTLPTKYLSGYCGRSWDIVTAVWIGIILRGHCLEIVNPSNNYNNSNNKAFMCQALC